MPAIDALKSLLGESPWGEGGRTFESVEQEWNVRLPQEFVEIGSAYGDTEISGFLFLCGPLSLGSYAAQMKDLLEANRHVPNPVLPSPGGMLLWGNTVEGDQLFLVDRGRESWTVSAFLRQWGAWYNSDLGLAEWLRAALSGEIATEWLPEWPVPHFLERL